MDDDTRPITDLLLELRSGDQTALDRLFPLVYQELRRVAHRQLRVEREDHTLGTTGLVHERGGAVSPVSLEEEALPAAERADKVLALDEALSRLAAIDARLSQVVECRFFGGYSEEEVAEVVGVDPRTVRRDWAKAKVWLSRELSA